MTPEGKIKALVDRALVNKIGLTSIWSFKPVQSGYGKRALDYICCICGHFVAIETKRPGEWLTPLQRGTAKQIHEAGGTVWIISEPYTVIVFERWLEGLTDEQR